MRLPKSIVDNVQERLRKPWLGYDAFSETSVAIANQNSTEFDVRHIPPLGIEKSRSAWGRIDI